MPLHRVQWSWLGKSGLATDRYINTFYFAGLAMDQTGAAALKDVVKRFYTLAVPTGNGVTTSRAVADHYPGAIMHPTTNLEVKMYTMEDPKPRVPFYVSQEAVAIGSETPMPAEVALTLSYKANAVSGVDQKRRRGRIFLGPLGTLTAAAADAAGAVRPTANLRAIVVNAAQRLENESAAIGQVWMIHSETTGPASAAQITAVRCDDAFDTQRRRGPDPTVRAWVTLT